MQSYFGIDFGTTNTAVVQLLVDEYGSKRVNCSEDDMPFSSVLAIHKKDGTVLFGRQVKAKRRQLSQYYHIFSSFKSSLGKDEKYEVAGREYSPTDITALFLRSIKDYVKSNMGLDISEAAFAIPVDFAPVQRRELKKAAEAAGIRVNKYLSESTAAYICNMDLVKGFSKVAVFDWGGGTLDISILEVNRHTLTELAVHGVKLGGDDIDRILAQKVHGYLAAEYNLGLYEDMSGKNKDDLLHRCEEAKIVLSTEDFCRIQLIDYGMLSLARVPVELSWFAEIIKPQIERAVSTLYEAAKKAQISVAQLDGIIMVGGSCEMQPIQEVMADLFEKKNIKVIYPEQMQWSVAAGAALVDASNLNYRLSQGIGVVLSDNSFFPILQKGTVVPWAANEIRFGVVEETSDAHFIFADENFNTIDIVNIPVKGFTTEGISLQARVDNDMIADFTLQSTYMGQRHKRKVEINKLGFYYDLTDVGKPAKNVSNLSRNIAVEFAETCMFAGCTERAVRRGLCSYHYRWEHAESK